MDYIFRVTGAPSWFLSMNFWEVVVHIWVAVFKIIDYSGHIIGWHIKNASFFSRYFFALMIELYPKKIDSHIFDEVH